jgi:hypothetical protein
LHQKCACADKQYSQQFHVLIGMPCEAGGAHVESCEADDQAHPQRSEQQHAVPLLQQQQQLSYASQQQQPQSQRQLLLQPYQLLALQRAIWQQQQLQQLQQLPQQQAAAVDVQCEAGAAAGKQGRSQHIEQQGRRPLQDMTNTGDVDTKQCKRLKRK